MVAAFGNLQIGIVLRRQPDALRRHQTGKRVVRLRQIRANVLHDLVGRMRPGNRQYAGVQVTDQFFARAQAAGHDYLAIFGQRFADRIQRFFDSRIDETAGIHHHQIGAFVGSGDIVSFGAQAGQNLLRIDQRLGTTETDKADIRDFSSLIDSVEHRFTHFYPHSSGRIPAHSKRP